MPQLTTDQRKRTVGMVQIGAFVVKTFGWSRIAVTIRQAKNRRAESDSAPRGPVLAYLTSAESLPGSDVIHDYFRSQG